MGQKNGRLSERQNVEIGNEDLEQPPSPQQQVQETFTAEQTTKESAKPVPKPRTKQKEETMKKIPKSSLKDESVIPESPVTPGTKTHVHTTSTPVANGVYVAADGTPSNLSAIDSGSGSEDETDDEEYNTDQQTYVKSTQTLRKVVSQGCQTTFVKYSDSSTQTDELISSPLVVPEVASSCASEDEDISDDEVDLQEESDGDWHPEHYTADDDSDDSDSSFDEINITNILHTDKIDERKYIVFESSIKQLLNLCRECHNRCVVVLKRQVGSMVVMEATCTEGHKFLWTSQPSNKQLPMGNLLLSASILFSGASITSFLNVLNRINVSSFTDRTYRHIQSSYLTPAVTNVWKLWQMAAIRKCEGRSVKLGGDARCCSPGHTAKYGSYSLMDLETGIVLDVQLVQDNRSLDRKQEVNFGRFYNKSYLNNDDKGYMKRSAQNLQDKKQTVTSFIKPANFSYSQDKPEFLKAKKGSGMMALASGKRVVKVHHKANIAVDLKNDEAVKLSMYPAGKPREANEPEKIERDDWPGPASPAAMLPEILRERRRSRGEHNDDDDDETDKTMDDPKIKRELEEMTKLKDQSGIGSVIYKELQGRKSLPVQPLNPWKSSRVPSAKYEPRYCTRYQSPMFASPSRFLDHTRRSWDDSDIRGYRSLTTLANLPIPKPGYGPGYGLSPRATTLPLSGAYGARVDYHYLDYDEEDQSRPDLSVPEPIRNEGRVQEFVEGPTISVLKLQKSTWHTETEPNLYDYERLKVTKFELPKDVDRNMLEIHLTDEDFDSLIKMPRDKFYKLAEWKRNDIKRKLDLF